VSVSQALGPARTPCVSCPYRRDTPPGVWGDEEYAKLERYDAETGEQPMGVFMCHQDTGRVCAGWAGCHDGNHLLALRLARPFKSMTDEAIEATIDYVSPVPLFGSGREAAEHGRSGIDDPSPDAQAVAAKVIERRQKRRRKRT
jgi:hypothetical protein